MNVTNLEDIPLGNIDWMERSKCSGMDTDFFFPETHDTRVFRNIREFCSDCPVRLECLEYSVRQGFEEGWFGGVPPRNRARYYRRLAQGVRHV